MLSIKVCDSNRVLPIIGCDGQDKDVLSPGDMVHIKASTHKVHLMHGKTYDYYENLRKKLNIIGFMKKNLDWAAVLLGQC